MLHWTNEPRPARRRLTPLPLTETELRRWAQSLQARERQLRTQECWCRWWTWALLAFTLGAYGPLILGLVWGLIRGPIR